jgi:hypothetical protein
MSGPFHVLLRSAIRDRGLPLDRLQARLAERGIQVGLASLSNWQQGRAWPQRANSLRAIGALEDILGLPSRALTGLLDGRRYLPFQSQQGIDEHTGPLGDLLDALPGARAWDLDVLTTEHGVTVGADRSPSAVLIRGLVRARRDGVNRVVLRYFGAPGCLIDGVGVRALRNCRVGQVLRHQEGRILIAELLFGQPLRAGQTWIYEGELTDPTASARTDFAHGFRRLEGNFLLEVRFAATALPSRVHGYLRTDLYSDRHDLTELQLTGHHTAHITASGMTSGVLGIAWEWPRPAGSRE